MSIFKKEKYNLPEETTLIYSNSLVNNIYAACTCCYDNNKDLTYFEKKEYIDKRISAGHDSILEHGRIAIRIINISNTKYREECIIELTTSYYSKYLEFFDILTEKETHDLIIYGSIRGFKHFLSYLSISDYNNPFVIKIINTLTSNTPKELYGKEVYDNIDNLENYAIKHNFVDIESNIDRNKNTFYTSNYLNYELIVTNTEKINNVNGKGVIIGFDKTTYEKLLQTNIPTKIIYDIMPVTVIFCNISRTATHQLVRHRNAITQQSQRYVNASDASFTIPVPEYNENKKYSITLFDSSKSVNLQELADELSSVYNQLLRQGLKKEEARAFLPSNINCGKLYMTFTINSLLKFIELRTDPYAQYEIRTYANKLKEFAQSIGFIK